MAWYDSLGKMAKSTWDFTGVPGLIHDVSTSMSNSDPWYVDALNGVKDITKVASTPIRGAVKGLMAAGQASYEVGGKARQWIEQGILDTPLMYNKWKNPDETYDEYRQRVAANKDKISLGQATLSLLSPGKNAGDASPWLQGWEERNLKFMSAGFDLFNPQDRQDAFNKQFTGKFLTGAADLANSTVIDPLTFAGFLGKGAVIATKAPMLMEIGGKTQLMDNIGGRLTKAVFGKMAATPDKMLKELDSALKGEGRGVKDINFLAESDAKEQWKYWNDKKVTNPDAFADLFGNAKSVPEVVQLYKAILLKDPEAITAVFNKNPVDGLALNALSDVTHEDRLFLSGKLESDLIPAEVSPDYHNATKSYIDEMSNDPRFVAQMQKVMTGNQIKYGFERGPLAGRTAEKSLKAADKTFAEPDAQFFQKTSLHPLIKVTNFFTYERPSGKFNLNDGNAYAEFNAWLTEANQLSKGTFAEKAASYADRFLNQVEPSEKANIIQEAERDALNHLFPHYTDSQLDKINAIYDTRRAKAIKEMKDQKFASTIENGQVVHNIDGPILNTEAANLWITADLRKLKYAIDAHESVLPGILEGIDVEGGAIRGKNLLASLDTINDIFKTSVLLRLGYTVRNQTEAGLSMLAKGYALPAIAASTGKEGVKRFIKNRQVGAERLIDSVRTFTGREQNLASARLDMAKASDGLQHLEMTQKQTAYEIRKRIAELESDSERLTKNYIEQQRALGNIVGPEEAKVVAYSQELKRLNAARADLESRTLYHGSPLSDFKVDSSKPLSTASNEQIANRYATQEFDVGLEHYLDPSGRPVSIRGVTGTPLERPSFPMGSEGVTRNMTSQPMANLKERANEVGELQWLHEWIADDAATGVVNFRRVQNKLRGVDHLKHIDNLLNNTEGEFAKSLRDSITRSVITKKTTLYRRDEGTYWHDAKVGDVITEPGFTATSKNPENLKHNIGTPEALMTIIVPKGHPGLDINKTLADFGKKNMFEEEQEVLLPQNTKFKIVKKEQIVHPFYADKVKQLKATGQPIPMQTHITVEALPPVRVRTSERVIQAAEQMKKDMILATRNNNTVLVRREGNKTFHVVSEDTIRNYDPASLERAVFKVRNNSGKVAKIQSYGKELDLNTAFLDNQDIRNMFNNDSRKYTEWVKNKSWQNPDDPIFQNMRDNGYGALKVPDDRRAGGHSHVVLPEYIGNAGKQKVIESKFQSIMDENAPMGPTNVTEVARSAKEQRVANKKAVRWQRTGIRDIPVNPDYGIASVHAMLNNGVEDAAARIMQQKAILQANFDQMAENLGMAIGKKERLSVKQRAGYGETPIEANGYTYTMPKVYQGAGWLQNRISAEPTWSSMMSSQEMAFLTGPGARAVRTIQPNDPRYFEGWANMIAHHFMNPETGEMAVPTRMVLDGKSDAQIMKWIKHTTEGQKWVNDAWTKMGQGVGWNRLVNGSKDEYLMEQLQRYRGSVKLYIPDSDTAAMISAAKVDERPQTAGDIEQFLTKRFAGRTDNPALNGLLVTTSKEYKDQERLIDMVNRRVMRFLGSLPEDVLARSPLAGVVYDRNLKLGIAQWSAANNAERLSPEILNSIITASREASRQEVERTLFTIVRRTGASGSQIMKLMFPFYGAYENTMQRWSGMIGENPSIVTRTARTIGQVVNSMDVVDQNGNRITDANQLVGGTNANLLVRVPQGFINTLPKDWQSVVNNAFKTIQIPLNSLDVVTQGQPGNPGFGPFAVLPAYLVLKDRPELEQAFKPFFPAGQPQGALDLFAPSALRRLKDMWSQDALYVRTYNQMLRYETYNYNTGQRNDEPTASEIRDKTNKFFLLRALTSITMPVAISPEADFYQQQYRKFQQLYPDRQDPTTGKWIRGEADAKFLEVYPDFFGATVSLSKNPGSLEPSVGVVRNLKKFGNLMAVAESKGDPELMGFLADDADGKYTFSQAAYQWQYSHGATPGSANAYRQNRPTGELVRDANIKQGWTEYGKLIDQIEVYKTQNGITSDKDPQMQAINFAKKAVIEQMAKNNEDWYSAYISPDRGKYMRRAEILQQALTDPKWMAQNGNRSVVKSVGLYLDARQQISTMLEQRAAAGGSKSLSANSNADLSSVWDSLRSQMSLESPEFSQFLNRYFPNDPVVV
jgi:hypothetical protein